MTATGTFEITLKPEPPIDERGGVCIGHAKGDKTFDGPLSARSTVYMLSARTPVQGSAGYVAVERIEGSLAGREGSFVVVHQGLMGPGLHDLNIRIVPDSGDGALTGIAGTMHISIVEGQHHYHMDYTLPEPA